MTVTSTHIQGTTTISNVQQMYDNTMDSTRLCLYAHESNSDNPIHKCEIQPLSIELFGTNIQPSHPPKKLEAEGVTHL